MQELAKGGRGEKRPLGAKGAMRVAFGKVRFSCRLLGTAVQPASQIRERTVDAASALAKRKRLSIQ